MTARQVLSTLLACTLACPAWSQTQWTVDDDGPADFSNLQFAVNSVFPGDVLLIQPGVYGDVSIDKRLTLLGDPSGERPVLWSVEVEGVPRFTLAHLTMSKLRVADVASGSEVDDCLLNGFQIDGLLRVEDAAQLRVQDTAIEPLGTTADGATGAKVEGASRVVFSDCEIRGGDATQDTFIGLSGWGGAGLRVLGDSRVTLAGCDVSGGDGEDYFLALGGFEAGRGGDAVAAFDQARVDVRGSSSNLLSGGIGDPFPVFGSSDDGFAVRQLGFSELRYSGVSLQGPVDLDTTEVTPAEPYGYVRGTGIPGEVERSFLFGPEGALAVLFASFEGALLELPVLAGIEVWLDPSQLAEASLFVLQGQDVAVNRTWETPLDPTFAGFTYELQGAVYDPLTDGFVGTNPAFIRALA